MSCRASLIYTVSLRSRDHLSQKKLTISLDHLYRSLLDPYYSRLLSIPHFIPHLLCQRLSRRRRVYLRFHSIRSSNFSSVSIPALQLLWIAVLICPL